MNLLVNLAATVLIATNTTVIDTDDHITMPASTTAVVIRRPFKDRHPRVYRAYRGVRRVCLAVKPIVEVAALAAQMATPFAVRR